MKDDTERQERLYFVKPQYVQYSGRGKKPKELARYEEQHDGEMPPFIPLPEEPVYFFPSAKEPLHWPAKGPLPEEVLEYVREWGVLPANSAAVSAKAHKLAAGADENEEDAEDADWDAEDWK